MLARKKLLSLLRKLGKKTPAMGNGAGEILGNRLPHVRERRAYAEIHAGACVRRVGQNGNIFARMVGGGPARIGIAAVVCSDHQQIGALQQWKESCEQLIEFLE